MPRLRLDPFSPSGVSIVAASPVAKQQNGYVARTEKLSQISDVDALTPSNGQALAYNSTTKTWRPTTISGGTGGGTTLPADAAGWLHDDGIGTLAWTTPAKSDVGLSNVDNTSDVNKPVSTATQTALNGKENSITIGTSSQYYRGDKTMQTLNQDAVPSGTTNKAYTATEQTKLAAITGTNTGDQTLSIAGSNLTISGANGNTVALPTGGTTSDATTTTKGIVQLAGDLAGTAALPTVPALANKAAKGANSDITSLSGLTTALSVAQGGTGSTTPAAALTALGGLSLSGGTMTGNINMATFSLLNAYMTSPNLTTPRADFLTDTNGGKEIELVATASSANWVKLTNTVTGSGVTIGVNGTGTNENLTLAAMGTGTVQVGGSQVTTAANTQTLANKTLTSPVISTISNTGTLTLPTTTGTIALTSSNITGTAANVTGTVAIGNGGTGVATLPAGILKGAGTGAITAITAPTGTIVGTTDTQTLSTKTFSDYVQVQGNASAPAAPATGFAKLYGFGTGASRPHWMTTAGNDETILTDYWTNELGYVQSTAIFSTASTSVVAVTGLSVTATIPVTARRVKVTFSCRSVYNSTSGAYNTISLWDGTVGTGTLLMESVSQSQIANGEGQMSLIFSHKPSNGSKTYNIGMKVSAGTGNISVGSPVVPMSLLVELV